MSKNDILSWFSENSEALSSGRILFILGMALAMSAVIFVTYRLTYSGVSYNARFNASNVIVVLVTAVIMMMISSNIAISLGMVGALSIVRFRTAIKDPHDTVYIFWSIVEGLCVGAQIHKLAILSTLFIALVLVAFSFYTRVQKKYLIIVRGRPELDEKQVQAALDGRFGKTRIRAVNRRETGCEMTCEITVRGELDLEAVRTLRELPGVQAANWLLEAGDNLG